MSGSGKVGRGNTKECVHGDSSWAVHSSLRRPRTTVRRRRLHDRSERARLDPIPLYCRHVYDGDHPSRIRQWQQQRRCLHSCRFHPHSWRQSATQSGPSRWRNVRTADASAQNDKFRFRLVNPTDLHCPIYQNYQLNFDYVMMNQNSSQLMYRFITKFLSLN